MKRGSIGLAISLLLLTPLGASSCNQASSCCGWNGSLEVGAHALYWRANDCSALLATSSSSSPVIEQALLRPDYDWGYRLFAGASLGCLTIGGDYNWFQSTDSSQSSLPHAGGVDGIYEQVSGSLCYDYKHADLRVGHLLHRRCGCDFSLYALARWIDLERTLEIEADSPEGDGLFIQQSKTSGGGLGVGARGSFQIWRGLAITGGLDLAGLVVERKNPIRHTIAEQTDEEFHYIYPNATAVIPAFDMQVALTYGAQCGCVHATIEIGYEIQQYWDLLAYGLAAEPTRRRYEDIGFTGLYLGGRIWF